MKKRKKNALLLIDIKTKKRTFTCEADDYSTSVNLGCKYLKACNVLRNGISSNPG